jgi:hypothetical protein
VPEVLTRLSGPAIKATGSLWKNSIGSSVTY